MIPANRLAVVRRHTATSDMEALQTDVMRFMAILGLCLTAIFALVQDLPAVTSTLPVPQTSSREIEVEQEKLVRVKSELLAVTSARQQAEQDRERLEQQLERVRDELVRVESQRSEPEVPAPLEKRPVSVIEPETPIQRVVKQEVMPVPVEPPVEAEPQQELESDSEEGFSLKFASDTALASLIRTRQVMFYAITKGGVWQLSANDLERFEQVPLSGQIFEMAPGTVPLNYPAALLDAVVGVELNRVVWGVSLPDTVRQRITAITRQHRSGEIVISANGDVDIDGGVGR